MNFAESLQVLRRRWYVTLPGVILTLLAALGAFLVIEPTYERSGTVLLLPDSSSIPEGANPFLYIGGLTQVADVVVKAAGTENFLNELEDEHPGVEVVIAREVSTTSPVIVVTTSAPDDAEAASVLDSTIEHIQTTLSDLQVGLPEEQQIVSEVLTIDEEGTAVQKERLTVAGVAALVGLVVTFLVAAAVEGLSGGSRRRRQTLADESTAKPQDEAVIEPETFAR